MHILLERNGQLVPGYSGGLLRLAQDLGSRLLPAFDTPTGVPLSWVNLKKARYETPNPPLIGIPISLTSMNHDAAGWMADSHHPAIVESSRSASKSNNTCPLPAC